MNISRSNDPILTILLSFDSSHRDESNDMYCSSLASILTELSHWNYLVIIGIGARSSDPILTILLSFDSSHQDESNDMYCSTLASILTELSHWNYLVIIGVGARSSDWIFKFLLSLDSSRWDESNDGKIIKIGQLVTELWFTKFLNIIRPKFRLILAKYFRNTKLNTESEIKYGIRIFPNKLLNNYGITELRNSVIRK